MAPLFTLYLFATSLVASAIGGALGMAGGILVVPILTASGIPMRTAVAASLVSVIACSCASAAPLLRRRLTNIRLAIVLELATTLGALTGVFVAGLLPASFLSLLFAAILLLSARQMLARRLAPIGGSPAASRGLAKALALDASYPEPETGTEVAYVVHRIPLAMGLMYAAGLVSALLGIGSGVLKIPAMDSALRLPLKVSSATSNFMIGVTAAASAGAYFARGEIVPGIAGPVALGSVVGALLGARLLIAVSSERVRGGFVVVLVLLATQMALQAFGLGIAGAGGVR
ncbi:MAG TPA: sulfite exporter TauE/SafE family protein [Polyangiaceae bacterium]|nr:sulfite exporter TauE/SafE family protein [Polyangiaceae bacterium]